MSALLTELKIVNHGPLLQASNFWDLEDPGCYYLSVAQQHATMRLLIPRSLSVNLVEMQKAKYVECTDDMLRFVLAGDRIGLDLIFDVGGPNLGLIRADVRPVINGRRSPWVFTAYTGPRKGVPHKALERPAWVVSANPASDEQLPLSPPPTRVRKRAPDL